MSNVIIFVDDASPKSPSYIVGGICRAIKGIDHSIKTIEINEEDLNGVLLRNSLDEVKKKIKEKVNQLEDTIIGICVDVVDARENEPQMRIRSGIDLVKALKEDSDTGVYKVISYTTRNMEISKLDEEWLEKENVDIIRKDDINKKDRERGKTVFNVMAERILEVLQWE